MMSIFKNETPIKMRQTAQAVGHHFSNSAAAPGSHPPKAFAVDDPNPLREYLAAIACGEKAAFEHFYHRTVDHGFGVAIRILRNACLAEEALSEAYLQVWRTAGKFDSRDGDPLIWLLAIVRSCALDQLRRHSKSTCHSDTAELPDERSAVSNQHDLMLVLDRDSALHQRLARLTPIQREMISLCFFRGLSHTEIAGITKLPLGMVKASLRQALYELQKGWGGRLDPH